jgi:DNA replication and repair protein RecF
LSFGIRHLQLDRFRNFVSLEREIHPGFTILAGPNAQGKTSFLEAIYWISTTRLLRGQRDSEAILQGESGCLVRAELLSGTSISASLEAGARKKFLLNGASLPRAADVIGRLPCVSISIFDLEIVRGEPSERRLFLDLELTSLYPAYLRHLATYKRALEQRNALLKLAQDRFVDDISFETWEDQLGEHGKALRKYRANYVQQLQPLASGFHADMASREEMLQLRYVQKDEGDLKMSLSEGRRLDIQRGTTQVGPHRDDLSVHIDEREARLFGSQGQQRTAVISLKLASLEVGTQTLGSAPVLLLDDMLSDLDPERRAKLCHVVASRAGQAILTCTEETAAGEEILERADVLRVQNGTVTSA